MGRTRYIDYHPDEYISGVGGQLDAAEQGVYWMICSLMMSAGGLIPEDAERVGHLCKLRKASAQKIIDRLVEHHGKLARTDGKLGQKRVVSELEKAGKRIQTASENGAKGGRPKGKTKEKQQPEKPDGFPEEKLTTNHQPPTESSSLPHGRERNSPRPEDDAPALPARASPPSGKKFLNEVVPGLLDGFASEITVSEDLATVRLSVPSRLMRDMIEGKAADVLAAFAGKSVQVAVSGYPPQPLAAPADANGLTPAQVATMNANIRRLGSIPPSEFFAKTGTPIHDATAEQIEAFVTGAALDIPDHLRRKTA